MLTNAVLPWVHYLSILILVGGVFAKLYLLKLAPTAETIRSALRADRLEGGAAAVVFITGLLQVWYRGKGADYYWSNGLFHGVVGLFVLAVLISIIPTVRLFRWNAAINARNELPTADVLRQTRIFEHVVMTLIVLVTLLITLVARGYGAAAPTAA